MAVPAGPGRSDKDGFVEGWREEFEEEVRLRDVGVRRGDEEAEEELLGSEQRLDGGGGVGGKKSGFVSASGDGEESFDGDDPEDEDPEDEDPGKGCPVGRGVGALIA